MTATVLAPAQSSPDLKSPSSDQPHLATLANECTKQNHSTFYPSFSKQTCSLTTVGQQPNVTYLAVFFICCLNTVV